MCAPKAPKVPPPAQYQAMQAPKDMQLTKDGGRTTRRRGFWASVMTGPGGLASPPTTTGWFSGVTGG